LAGVFHWSFDHLLSGGKKLREEFEPEPFGGVQAITKSNLLDCLIGRSPGISPLRIRVS
jgi:hypothetical protein